MARSDDAIDEHLEPARTVDRAERARRSAWFSGTNIMTPQGSSASDQFHLVVTNALCKLGLSLMNFLVDGPDARC
jgi:hypothetical protein